MFNIFDVFSTKKKLVFFTDDNGDKSVCINKYVRFSVNRSFIGYDLFSSISKIHIFGLSLKVVEGPIETVRIILPDNIDDLIYCFEEGSIIPIERIIDDIFHRIEEPLIIKKMESVYYISDHEDGEPFDRRDKQFRLDWAYKYGV